MFLDVITRFLHQWWFGVLALDDELIRQGRQLLRKKCEKPHDRVVFVRRDEWIFLPCLTHPAVETQPAMLEFARHFSRVGLSRHMAHNLSYSQITNDRPAEADRDSG